MPIELTNEYYEYDKHRHLPTEFERNERNSIFKNVLHLSESWENDEILNALKKIMPLDPNSIKAYGLTEELLDRYLNLIDTEINNKHEAASNELKEGIEGADTSEAELKEIIRKELFSKCESGKNIKDLTELVEKPSEAGSLIIDQIKKYFGCFDLNSRIEIIENIKNCKQYTDAIINYAILDMKEDQIIELIPEIKDENNLILDIVNKLLYNKGIDDYSEEIIQKITPRLIEVNNDEALKTIFNKLVDDENENKLIRFNKMLTELPLFYHKDAETIYLRPWLLKLRHQIQIIKERNNINTGTRNEVKKIIE